MDSQGTICSIGKKLVPTIHSPAMFQLFRLLITLSIIFAIKHNGIQAKSVDYCGTKTIRSFDREFRIEYPFWWDNDYWREESARGYEYEYPGYPEFAHLCAQDGRPVINITNNLYYVHHVNYLTKTFTVIDISVDGQECPHPKRNFSFGSTSRLTYNTYSLYNVTIFYNCSNYPVDMVQHLLCLEDYSKNNTSDGRGRQRSYAFLDDQIREGFHWYNNCTESVVVPVTNYSSLDSNYAQALKLGFQLKWSPSVDCQACEDYPSKGKCLYNMATGTFTGCLCPNGKLGDNKICFNHGIPTGLKATIGVSTGFGGILLVLLLIYRRMLSTIVIHWKNKFRSATKVEEFLESYDFLALQRYKYSDVKKMTNSFEDPLGEGGYGSVFKGKLSNGRLVAVKVLNGSKGNGEDFINEVTTIGRTNHVNVVSLLGFCTDGVKRALVYEFMPNGSLERFIYTKKKSEVPSIPHLGLETLYQIALGIARGLEYLHCRCNTRIVHFDIKPHNILLDHEFCPKISDFGLAKLCPSKDSVVSMLGARGTIGYIAPEIYCRNFGGASHKSDVYSYGMMVLEMIGGRKNTDVTVKTSEIYFPQWIYNHLKQEIEVEGDIEISEEEKAKKMIIVALSCIQTHPASRPSISKVVEMLEGDNEELQMPPNPFQDLSSETPI